MIPVEYLTEIGLGTIALTALGLVYKLSSNHIRHNTEVMTELRDAIRELTNHLKKK